MNMNLKDLVVPFTLAIVTTLALQYYWGGTPTDQSKVDTAGQRIEAPIIQKELYKPLNLEIDFYDKETKRPEVETKIEAPHAHYLFSSDGATLQRVAFKRTYGGKTQYLTILEPLPQTEREARAFLVALDRQTPYYYTLDKQDEDDKAYYLTYSADFGDGTLEKKFTIYKDVFQIDLGIGITLKTDAAPVQARLFVNAPHIKDLGDDDKVTAFVNNEVGKIKKYADVRSAMGAYWVRPSILGLQDRYFVNSLVADASGFVQRGYFKLVQQVQGSALLQAILESNPVSKTTSWVVSLYIGPKTADAMTVVDPRLEETIEYGFFAWLSRPMSKILLKFLNFLYDYVHNYGLAIIIITLLMRLIMVPFTFKAAGARKKQEEFQKRIKYIQQRYKDDPQALAQARMELVRKHGVIPGGAGGCVPLLLQLPIFWGLHVVLSSAIELYQAPFLWISDLSSPDPFYILPVLTGIGIVLASPTGTDPKQRFVGFAMGLFFMAITASFAAGLALYMATSMLFAAAQITVARMMKKS